MGSRCDCAVGDGGKREVLGHVARRGVQRAGNEAAVEEEPDIDPTAGCAVDLRPLGVAEHKQLAVDGRRDRGTVARHLLLGCHRLGRRRVGFAVGRARGSGLARLAGLSGISLLPRNALGSLKPL